MACDPSSLPNSAVGTAQSEPLRRPIGALQAQVFIPGDEALHAIVEPVLFLRNLPDGSAQKARITSDDRIHVLGGYSNPHARTMVEPS